jgi:hypothetical protein
MLAQAWSCGRKAALDTGHGVPYLINNRAGHHIVDVNLQEAQIMADIDHKRSAIEEMRASVEYMREQNERTDRLMRYQPWLLAATIIATFIAGIAVILRTI